MELGRRQRWPSTHAAPGCHRSPMSQHGGHTCDPSTRDGEAEEQKFKIILG